MGGEAVEVNWVESSLLTPLDRERKLLTCFFLNAISAGHNRAYKAVLARLKSKQVLMEQLSAAEFAIVVLHMKCADDVSAGMQRPPLASLGAVLKQWQGAAGVATKRNSVADSWLIGQVPVPLSKQAAAVEFQKCLPDRACLVDFGGFFGRWLDRAISAQQLDPALCDKLDPSIYPVSGEALLSIMFEHGDRSWRVSGLGQRQADDTFDVLFQSSDGFLAATERDVFSDESCRRVLPYAFAASMLSLIVNWAKEFLRFLYRCVLVQDCAP